MAPGARAAGREDDVMAAERAVASSAIGKGQQVQVVFGERGPHWWPR
jgi:hypothetical protein